MNTFERMDPHEAFTNLREQLVFSFALSRERCRFTLACEYPHKLPGAHRAFAGFVFDEVHGFAREQGDLEKYRSFTEQFHSRSVEGAIVIQSIKSTCTADERHLDVWFGYNFGGLQFRYGSATAYRRDAVAREVRGEWLYRDAHSQEEFDFYEPFPDLMKPS